MTQQEYMESLVLIQEKEEVKINLQKIIQDFRMEGFYDEDIYDFIRDLVLTEMHKKYKQ